MNYSKTFLVLFIYTFLFVCLFSGFYIYFLAINSEGIPQNSGGTKTTTLSILTQGFADKITLIEASVIAVVTSAFSILILKNRSHRNRFVSAFIITIIFTITFLLTVIAHAMIFDIAIDKYFTPIKKPLIFNLAHIFW